MAYGKTFKIGRIKVNFSKRGIAAIKEGSEGMFRLPFPWANPKSQRPRKEDDYDDRYDDHYDEDEYEGDYEGDYDEYGEEILDDDYSDDGYDRPKGGILDSFWLAIVLLVVLPPLGIYLLWRNEQFDFVVRSAISAVSVIWCVILLIWIFSGLGQGKDSRLDPPVVNASPTPTITASPEPSEEPSPTPVAPADQTPQPDVTNEPTTTQEPPIYIWHTEGGTYYHSKMNCSKMTDAIREPIAKALELGQLACPVCMEDGATADPSVTVPPGGTGSTDEKYYSTPKGTNYHVDPNCRGMVGAQLVSMATITERNQTPCGTCIGNVYATKTGTYYHTKSDCSKMVNAQMYTIAKAKEEGKVACYVCAGGTPVKDDAKKDNVTYYYGTTGGTYYHKTSNCSGMQGASKMTAAAAEATGKTACPTCLNASGSGNTAYYYATSTGAYYHTKSNCSGMQNASKVTKEAAVARKQGACPVCIGNVYATDGGTYYHSKSSCSGMQGARLMTVSAAKSAGKKACPTCIDTSSSNVSTPSATAKPVNTTSSSGYYSTEDGVYYHTKIDCSGMIGASGVSASQIIRRGQSPCPKCVGTTTTYYSTPTGTYYHIKDNCSGMQKAGIVTLSQIKDRGQTACPECIGGSGAPATTYVYATRSGTYYHVEPKCSGMRNATKITQAEAELRGQSACPVCLFGDSGNTSIDAEIYYHTQLGKYYHVEKYCSNMGGAIKCSRAQAQAINQKPCPVCILKEKSSSTSKPSSTSRPNTTSKPNTTSTPKPSGTTAPVVTAKPTATPTAKPQATIKPDGTDTYVWCVSGASRYHADENCGGMKNASYVPLSWATTHGYQRCATCNAPSAN